MPHDEVSLECSVGFCSLNWNGQCASDYYARELSPDRISCPHFDFAFGASGSEKIDEGKLLEYIKESGVPYVVVDRDSDNFEVVKIGGEAAGIVRGSEKDVAEFRFWKNVDGGIGCTHEDQTELELNT